MAGAKAIEPPLLIGPERRAGFALIAALALTQAAAAAGAAVATRLLFGALHGGTGLPHWPLAGLAATGLAIAAARVAARITGERLGESYARDVRAALFRHAARMSPRDVERRRAGYMALRFVGDLSAFKRWLSRGLPRAIAAAAVIPATVAALALMSPAFGLAAAGLLLPALAALWLSLRPLEARWADLRAARARLAAEMAERMPRAPELGRLGREATELRQMRARSAELADLAARKAALAEALRGAGDALFGVLAAAIVALGFLTDVPAAAVAAGLAASGLMAASLRDLASAASARAAFLAAHAKLEAALERPTRPRRKRRRKLPKRGALDVILPLAGGGRVEIAAGETVLLAGPPGSGKSALLAALSGREEAPRGLRLAGLRPRDIDRRSLRARVAHVDRAPLILAGSLRRALTLGLDRRPSDGEIVAAAERWGLGPTLARLGGLDGRVAEEGRDLSETERVLIGLARASLSRPGLWLLDDVASSLDAAPAEALAEIAGADATVIAAGGLPDRLPRRVASLNQPAGPRAASPRRSSGGARRAAEGCVRPGRAPAPAADFRRRP